MRDLNLLATPSRLTLISPALLQHKEMVHKKLTSPGCRVNKMMMKYKFKARRKVSLKAKKTTKMVMTKKKTKKNTPLANCDDAKGKQLRKDDDQDDEGYSGDNNPEEQAASNIGDESGNASQRLTPQNSKGTADTKVSGKCSDDHLEPREENTLSIREEMEALGLLDDTISGRATAKQMVFEPIEILEVSAIAEVKKMVEDCMHPLPMPDSGLNLPLKEESEKFEAKQIKDAIDNHLSPETKKELRTKRTATRTDFMTRKKLAAESLKAACHLPPLAPKKDNGKKTSDKMQLPQEVKGSNELKQNSKSPQSNENKKDEASAASSTTARINVYTKKPRKISTEMEKLVEASLPTDKGEESKGPLAAKKLDEKAKGISGEGGSNLPIMRTIEEIKKSKGYRDAPDAPSFSLGFDDVTQKSPIKSTTDDFITSSMFDQLCDDAMKNSAKHQDYSTINTNPTINTNHLSPEQETIYNEICKWRSRSGADISYCE
ncbi:uncharacterized protein LOC120710233 [Panicum virgatum]|uniref:uncharacterized protein LOC120710233 n=1 Tax=Panicum virgatum TaxID=38727 RepID=UPI0019D5F27F|nr:uncharacterized protein LOC120710233 [Panicum virgatum]